LRPPMTQRRRILLTVLALSLGLLAVSLAFALR
jgi:hypothetical protein